MFWDGDDRIIGKPREILRDLETWEVDEEVFRQELKEKLIEADEEDMEYVLCAFHPMGAWFVREMVAR